MMRQCDGPIGDQDEYHIEYNISPFDVSKNDLDYEGNNEDHHHCIDDGPCIQFTPVHFLFIPEYIDSRDKKKNSGKMVVKQIRVHRTLKENAKIYPLIIDKK